ncbi:MAG: hypothetical protein LBI15_05105 [Dysgonamonadaceae bacterium]|jgi:hypothetical protein|nr:hypothetical protein [Dysgonamonadaceae bacterium]
MRKKVFLIICFSAFLLVGCGKHTNSIHLELNLANKTLQDSLQYEKLMTVTVVDSANVSNGYKNAMTATDTTTVLSEIVKHTDNIVRHTEPVFWKKPEAIAVFAVIIAIIALFVAFNARKWTEKGALWQKQAEINTRAMRQIQKEQQEFILLDFIRHLYRNKVVISTLQWKLDKKYDTYYPSDEHILKLRIPLEELKLDRFSNSSNHFDELHKLKLLCRNVNIEVGIAYEHLKMKKNQFLAEDKKLDLDVLEFKCQLLTKKIIELMCKLDLLKAEKWNKEIEEIRNSDDYKLFESIENKGKEESDKIKDEYLQKIQILLYSKIQDNKDETVKFKDYYDAEKNYRKEEKNYREEGKEYLRRGGKIYYSDILQISAQLNYDVYMEGKGKNDGKGVIKLIKFQ